MCSSDLTPLAVLKGELEAIEDGVRQPTRDNLAALQNEVGALTQLVDDLYELALADVGALSYQMAPIDLREVIEPELQLLRHVATERGLRVRAELPPQPLRVMGDAGRLRQLLRNILTNALRYTDAGEDVPAHIEVRLGLEGEQVAIDVVDAPPGVPDELLPRLFDRFFRVEASRNRASGGSGLGLAICRSIAQAHEGSIEARHAPSGGLWVAVRLPRAPRAASTGPAVLP